MLVSCVSATLKILVQCSGPHGVPDTADGRGPGALTGLRPSLADLGPGMALRCLLGSHEPGVLKETISTKSQLLSPLAVFLAISLPLRFPVLLTAVPCTQKVNFMLNIYYSEKS